MSDYNKTLVIYENRDSNLCYLWVPMKNLPVFSFYERDRGIQIDCVARRVEIHNPSAHNRFPVYIDTNMSEDTKENVIHEICSANRELNDLNGLIVPRSFIAVEF